MKWTSCRTCERPVRTCPKCGERVIARFLSWRGGEPHAREVTFCHARRRTGYRKAKCVILGLHAV